jgi:glycosyltransferase involved in cell wall biosynthesis
MINGKRIAVVTPAYNVERTLEQTLAELPDTVDIRILVDDHSSDAAAELAKRLRVLTFVHDRSNGYGRNQQTCYREALQRGPTSWSWFILITSTAPARYGDG